MMPPPGSGTVDSVRSNGASVRMARGTAPDAACYYWRKIPIITLHAICPRIRIRLLLLPIGVLDLDRDVFDREFVFEHGSYSFDRGRCERGWCRFCQDHVST